MDSTIAAACISGGVGALGVVGTAITAWIGSRNTRKATERTVEAGTAANRATLAAAREDRLWEKRASSYEESLTGLLHRQAQRHFETRKFRTNDESERKLEEFYANYELPGMFETQGRLVAYASDPVMNAFNASRAAHARVRVQHGHIAELQEEDRIAQRSGRPQGVPGGESMKDARLKLDDALKAADAADDALINVIRNELRSKPEAVMPLTVPSRGTSPAPPEHGGR